MKTKNVIIGSGVVLGGVALYLLFFRKNKNSQGVSSVDSGNASTGLLLIGSGGISQVGGGVLGSAVVQKDTTQEEFDMYYKTYRNIKQKIVEKDKPIELSNIFKGSSRIRMMKMKEAKRDKELESLRSDLLDYEKKIIDLGYTPTGRGTFVKTGSGVTNSVKTSGFFKRS